MPGPSPVTILETLYQRIMELSSGFWTTFGFFAFLAAKAARERLKGAFISIFANFHYLPGKENPFFRGYEVTGKHRADFVNRNCLDSAGPPKAMGF
jgi:hypothetical protein